MNVAITDGVALMPPAFAAGLQNWSSGDGLPGDPGYDGAVNAALASGDADFGTCLEMMKTVTVQKLRAFMETPILPGVYLRVRARVKAVSGNLPGVRIAAWAGDVAGNHLAGVVETGPEVALTAYGEVVEISAIIGTGHRTGVDMAWGKDAARAHVGLDLTGPDGGVVRIDDIVVEDVTHVFHRKLMDWVDVRDYGAKGDGVSDDHAAFLAADADAGGREILVPAGSYFIGQSLTLTHRVRFEGMVQMPAAAVLALTRNFDFPSYAAAFGDEEEGLRRGLQALFHFTDHESFDLGGRRIEISQPIDVHAAASDVDSYASRRVITNGQIAASAGAGWNDDVITSAASWDPAAPQTLTAVQNLAAIPVGARVSGTGVGREVYVQAKDVAAGTITLSLPLQPAAAGAGSFTFTRHKYLLDFSGFTSLTRFVIANVEFLCGGLASGVMLPPGGAIFHIRDCFFTAPKDKAVTSPGSGCQGLLLDRNQFLSNEQALAPQDRSSIAFNVNANDAKIRDNRAVRFLHFGVLHGSGHMIEGNHFFQGDDQANGLRTAGLVITKPNCKTTLTGNYIDNCFIEWGNEHDPAPDQANELSFGGLVITGNIFTSLRSVGWMRFIRIKPYGNGHFLNGFSLTDNAFRHGGGGTLERVDEVDASVAPLDTGRMRNVTVSGNSFHQIATWIASPLIREVVVNTPAASWRVDLAPNLPFGGRARTVTSVLAEGPLTNGAGATVWTAPHVLAERGASSSAVDLVWPEPVAGKVQLTVRVDNPM